MLARRRIRILLVLEVAEPCGFGVADNLLPGMPSDWTGRDWVVETSIDCDIFRHNSGL